jgi:DNA modification methylase
MENTLYYGDNLDILRRYIASESVDLIYLDPPFNSNQDYNVLFHEQGGAKATAQIKAFEDTWEWNIDAARAYEEVVESGGNASSCLQAFRTMLGESNMMAYLAMMAPRLIELHRALASTGSIYLHCDPTASHYLKVLMDAIFEPRNFRNEITWTMRGIGRKRRISKFPTDTQRILFYTKSRVYTFNEQTWEESIAKPHKDGKFVLPSGFSRDEQKRVYWTSPRGDYTDDSVKRLEGEGRIYRTSKGNVRIKYFVQETATHILVTRPVTDSWTDIPDILRTGHERLGYPTQKPQALLARIIATSSKSGDLVLDPFCGCGTAVSVAQQMGMRWIGIDITHLAIGLIKHRLADSFGPSISSTYRVIGEPVSVPDARELATEDQFQFQAWALGLVGARTAHSDKRGADRGIDGNLYFHDDSRGTTKRIILSVKAGQNVGVGMVRDLVGTVTRERADIGVLISMSEPTSPMLREAVSAGFYASPMGGSYPRIQILTIAQLLDGKGIEYPARSQRADRTFKKARRIERQIQELPLSAFIAPDDNDT